MMGFLHSRCFVGFSEPSPIQREVSWMTRALRKKRVRVDKQGWSGWTLMANCVWMSCFYSLWLKRSENFRPPKASRQSVVRLALSACSTGKTRSALTCTGIIPASSSSAALEPSTNVTSTTETRDGIGELEPQEQRAAWANDLRAWAIPLDRRWLRRSRTASQLQA